MPTIYISAMRFGWLLTPLPFLCPDRRCCWVPACWGWWVLALGVSSWQGEKRKRGGPCARCGAKKSPVDGLPGIFFARCAGAGLRKWSGKSWRGVLGMDCRTGMGGDRGALFTRKRGSGWSFRTSHSPLPPQQLTTPQPPAGPRPGRSAADGAEGPPPGPSGRIGRRRPDRPGPGRSGRRAAGVRRFRG